MGVFGWLFGKKSTDDENEVEQLRAGRAESGPRTAWKTGDRVLASWLDSFFYPGRVRSIQGNKCEIAFDDGDVAMVHVDNVRKPDIGQGSKVFCRFHAGPMYMPATVQQQNGEKIQVHYENGDKEWTTISMVRVQRPLANVGPAAVPGPMPAGPSQGAPMSAMTPGAPIFGMPPTPFIPDVGDPVTDSNWCAGDRVLGRWFDFFWYPATVLAIGSKGYHLLFDDGDQRVVQDLGLMPLDVEEGEELFIRPKNQPQRIYTPAKVLRVQGEDIDVELEDGTHESNQKLSRARFWRCPVGFQSLSFDEGERVLAQDGDGFIYPAEVLSIDHDKVMVHFLDGPERMLTPELIKPFDLKAGMPVECRWKGGQNYFPGKITQIDGDRVHIAYNDGDKEFTTVRLVRLAPKEVRR